MTAEETAKKLYECFNKHDIPGILALLSDDVEWNSFSVDWALAVGYFNGPEGVQDFFMKLVGPEGQQHDIMFEPMAYWASGSVVHVVGVEEGTLTKNVKDGALEGKKFINNFDHTVWVGDDGKITTFRANYNLSIDGKDLWPRFPGAPKQP